MSRLHALVKQGRAYLQRRLDDPELQPETDSAIAAWLGHAWQLRELKDVGLVETDAELVQLAFHSHDDAARQEVVDTGVWMMLNNGRIRLTQNFRPYKAAKFIKSDDSFFQVAQVKELCVYPSDVESRASAGRVLPPPAPPRRPPPGARPRPAGFRRCGEGSEGLPQRRPLADKRPVYALNFARLGLVGGRLGCRRRPGRGGWC